MYLTNQTNKQKLRFLDLMYVTYCDKVLTVFTVRWLQVNTKDKCPQLK